MKTFDKEYKLMAVNREKESGKPQPHISCKKGMVINHSFSMSIHQIV
jgi:hypothetical protein